MCVTSNSLFINRSGTNVSSQPAEGVAADVRCPNDVNPVPVVPTSATSGGVVTGPSLSANSVASAVVMAENYVGLGDGTSAGQANTIKSKRRRKKVQKPGKTAKQQERHFVKHNYHDYAQTTEEDMCTGAFAAVAAAAAVATASSSSSDEDEDTNMKVVETRKERRGGVAMSFPYKLHTMLDKIDGDGLAHVVSWQPHGRAFKIHKPKDFVDIVMPRYFNQTKLTSFQRQLNLYGFTRLSARGGDEGAYYHELFLRGRVFLCSRMVRTKCKGTGFKAASSPDSEPNFYLMEPVAPLLKVSNQQEQQQVASAHCVGVIPSVALSQFNTGLQGSICGTYSIAEQQQNVLQEQTSVLPDCNYSSQALLATAQMAMTSFEQQQQEEAAIACKMYTTGGTDASRFPLLTKPGSGWINTQPVLVTESGLGTQGQSTGFIDNAMYSNNETSSVVSVSPELSPAVSPTCYLNGDCLAGVKQDWDNSNCAEFNRGEGGSVSAPAEDDEPLKNFITRWCEMDDADVYNKEDEFGLLMGNVSVDVQNEVGNLHVRHIQQPCFT